MRRHGETDIKLMLMILQFSFHRPIYLMLFLDKTVFNLNLEQPSPLTSLSLYRIIFDFSQPRHPLYKEFRELTWVFFRYNA